MDEHEESVYIEHLSAQLSGISPFRMTNRIRDHVAEESAGFIERSAKLLRSARTVARVALTSVETFIGDIVKPRSHDSER